MRPLVDKLALVLNEQGIIDFIREGATVKMNDRAYWTILRPSALDDIDRFCKGAVVGLHADGVGLPTNDAMAIGVISTDPDTVGPRRLEPGAVDRRGFRHAKNGAICVQIAFVGEVDVLMNEAVMESILAEGKEVFLCCRGGAVEVWDPSEPPRANQWVFGMTRFTLRTDVRYVDRLPVMISHQTQCRWIKSSIERLDRRVTILESGFEFVKSSVGSVTSQLRGMQLAMYGLGFFHLCILVSALFIVVVASNTDFGGAIIHTDHVHYQGIYVDQQPLVRLNVMSHLIGPPDHSPRCACLRGRSGTGKSQMGTSIAYDPNTTKRFIGGVFDIKCPVEYDEVGFLKDIHATLFLHDTLTDTEESYPARKLLPIVRSRIASTFVEQRHWFYEKLSNLGLVSGPVRPILVIANNVSNPEHVHSLYRLLRVEDSLLITSQIPQAESYCTGFKLNVLQKDDSREFLRAYVGEEKFNSFSHDSILDKADGLAMNLAAIGKRVVSRNQSWAQIEELFVKESDRKNSGADAEYKGRQDSVFAMLSSTLESFESSDDIHLRDLAEKFGDLSTVPAGAADVAVFKNLWGHNHRALLNDLVANGLLEYTDSTASEVFIHDHIGQYVRGRVDRFQKSTDKFGKQVEAEAKRFGKKVEKTAQKTGNQIAAETERVAENFKKTAQKAKRWVRK